MRRSRECRWPRRGSIPLPAFWPSTATDALPICFRTRLELPYRCIVKGDGKYADIAAASVLAKTHRDEYMLRLAEVFPQYGWRKNKGYPTREHRLAIREYGLTPHHRLTFNHEIDQLELPF